MSACLRLDFDLCLFVIIVTFMSAQEMWKVLDWAMPGIEQRGVLCPAAGLAAPLNVREGDVTDTSIQISWDRTGGD